MSYWKLWTVLRTAPPFLCELIGENQYDLMVGIGGKLGFVQYSHHNGDPPYWAALDVNNTGDFVNFLITNTPTEIPPWNCLPFAIVKQIAA